MGRPKNPKTGDAPKQLKPFRAGISGNPLGINNRIPTDIKILCKQHTRKAVETIVALLDDDDPRVRMVAAANLLDRGYGKPAQQLSVEVQNKVEAQENLTLLTNEELEYLENIKRKLASAKPKIVDADFTTGVEHAFSKNDD